MLISCGDYVKKEELAAVEQKFSAKIDESIFKVKGELTDLEKKYITVEQLKVQVESSLTKLNELLVRIEEFEKKINEKSVKMREDLIKTISLEQRILQERTRNLQLLLDELKKGTESIAPTRTEEKKDDDTNKDGIDVIKDEPK